jgi:hypothetical protein
MTAPAAAVVERHVHHAELHARHQHLGILAAVGGQDGHPVALPDAAAVQGARQLVDPPVGLAERAAGSVVEDEAVAVCEPLGAQPQEVARLDGVYLHRCSPLR